MGRSYNTPLDLKIAQTEEMRQIAKSILTEGEYYRAPEHKRSGRWKGTPPSAEQMKLIRMRRGGPGFEYRIPEPLYKALMMELTGEWSSSAIRNRGQAVLYLDAINHIDPFDLQRIQVIIEKLAEQMVGQGRLFEEEK